MKLVAYQKGYNEAFLIEDAVDIILEGYEQFQIEAKDGYLELVAVPKAVETVEA